MTRTMIGKSVSIAGLTKRYGDLEVLNGVDLEIAAGEFCTLLGASGSGKTTLLKVIAGFEASHSGQVNIGERNIGRVPVAKRNIGMVFQNYALFPHLSVHNNVAFGLEMRNLPRDEVDRCVREVLELVSMADFAMRRPTELSGGQQQRVALARALVINPDVLLMDEPLGALDKNLRQAIQLQLKQLHRDLCATVVYVTHDQEEALQLSDRIAILEKGRVIQSGSPRELYFRPANRFVANFLGECNFIELDNGREIGIRPEAFSLVDTSNHDSRRITLHVSLSLFVGTGIKLFGRYQGQEIAAFIDNDKLDVCPEPGSVIELSFDEGSVIEL